MDNPTPGGDRLRQQYAANARALAGMLRRAESTGRPVNGYTAEVIRERAEIYRQLAVASDADLSAHLAVTRAQMRARLDELQRSPRS